MALPVEPLEEGFEAQILRFTGETTKQPTFMPTPDPVVPLGALGKRLDWSDVFDWAKEGISSLFHGGTHFSQVTPEMVEQAANAATGQAIKATSGFIEGATGMTVHLAQLLDASLANLQSNALHDYRDLSQRIDRLQAHNDFIDEYVVPNLDAKIKYAESFAFATSLAAQQNAQDWGVEHIFAPLYDELLKVQPAIDASVKANNPKVLDAAESKVNALHDLVAPQITAAAALATKANDWIDDCGEPMCENLGPKTDLGKLLKGLATAATLADIAYLLSLTEADLVQKITETIGHFAGYVGELEQDFFQGGKRIGEVITGL